MQQIFSRKSFIIFKEPLRCKLEIKEKIIEQVMTIKYLGVNINYSRLLNAESQGTSNEGAKNIRLLKRHKHH